MTEHYEITKAYNNQKTIYICQHCLEEGVKQPLQWLDGNHNEVAMTPPITDYQHYSHGVCEAHLAKWRESRLEKIAKGE